MATKYLDKIGLAYFWSKLKAWIASSASNLVHATGAETISGEKVFSDSRTTTLGNKNNIITMQITDITRGTVPSDTYYSGVGIIDSTGSSYPASSLSRLSAIAYKAPSSSDSSSRTFLQTYKFDSSDDVTMGVGYDSNNISFAYAPSTKTERPNGNNDILTRDWIPKDTRIVHTVGNELISGLKVFCNNELDYLGRDKVSRVVIKNDNILKGTPPEHNIWSQILFTDSSDNSYETTNGAVTNRLGMLQCIVGTNTNSIEISAYKQSTEVSEQSDEATLVVGYDADGIKYAKAPETSILRNNDSDIVTRSWIPLDDRIVHTVNDEIISGLKTFTNTIGIKNEGITRGIAPSNNKERVLYFYDSAGNKTGAFSSIYFPDKSSRNAIYAYNTTVAIGNNIGYIGIGCDKDGNVFTYAPTPIASSNDTNIATTAYVKAQGYVTENNKVRQISGTDNSDRPILVRYNAAEASEIANYAVYNDNVTINTSTGVLTTFGSHLVKRPGVTKGINPSSTQYWTLTFCDKDGGNYTNNCIGMLETFLSSTGVTATYLRAMKNVASSTVNAQLSVVYDTANDVAYATCPTPASTTENGNKIATTAWVRTATGNTTLNAANVTGTVAIANGGTGATTRLNAIKALTNENVGTNATHFLGLKSDWSKVGYFTLSEAKTLLGLGSAAYTASTAYAAASHTHSYLPLSGGTLTGPVYYANLMYKSTTIDRTDITTDSYTELWTQSFRDKNNLELGYYGFERRYKEGRNRLRFRLRNTSNKWADLVFSLNDDNEYYVFLTGTTGTTGSGFHGNSTTATQFASAQSITLTGAVTGTASSQAGWSIGTTWRSCIVGQSANSSTNPWYKVATFTANYASDDSTIAFLVENTYYSHSSGILKIHVRIDAEKKVYTDASEIFWISCSRGIADALDQFVLVCPTTASPTVELWTKVTNPWMHRRFTVLSEGDRTSTKTRWTLLNTSTAGQAASITTAGTQIKSKLASVSSVCLGNATAATKLVTARTINGVSFDGSANITIADSTKLPLTGGNLTGIVRNTGSFVTNGNFYKQHTTVVKGTDPDASCFWFYYFCDKNGLDYTNNAIGLLECRLDSNGRTNIYLRAIKNTAASSATIAELGVAYDKATDTGYAYTTIAPVASANDNKIPTTAWVRTYASSTYVDLTTAQDITGIKRFTNNISFKNTDLIKSSIPSSNVYKSIYWVDKNNDGVGRFLLYQNSSANGGAKALTIDLYNVASSPAGNVLMNMGISNVASESSDSYIAIGSNVKFVRPSAAGTTLGTNSTDRRWGQIYSSSTTISTSDERMKDEITVVPDEVLDCWELIPWMQFKMKSSIAEKGNKARLHNGIIAQTVAKTFEDFNLDASKYGLFCYDEWNEDEDQYDSNGNLVYKGTEAGNLYSIRYEEALCMEAAYQRRKNKILENRISELENQLSSVLQILKELKGVG